MVSVIIPIYNGELYIRNMYKCLEEQTYTDLQIILVNDGSMDGSAEICGEIAERDPRVTVIHQKNSGVSAARNVAIELVEGEYTAFLDVDDLIKSDYFEVLLRELEQTGADIVCCGHEAYIPLADGKLSLSSERCQIFDGSIIKTIEQHINEYFGYRRWNHVVWAKLFKTKVVHRVRFELIRYGEDGLYMFEICKQCLPKVYLSPYVGYMHILWENSSTRNIQIKTRVLETALTATKLAHYYMLLDTTNKDDCFRIQSYFGYFISYLYATIWAGEKQFYYSDEFEKQVYFEQYKKYLRQGYYPSFKSSVLLKIYCLNKKLCWFVVKMYPNSRT